MKKQQLAALSLAGVLALSQLYGCSNSASNTQGTEAATVEDTTALETGSISEDLDVTWNAESATGIVFEGGEIGITGEGAKVSGTTVTIQQAGTYVLSGTLSDGQVVVDAGKEDAVRLVLNGVEISNSNTSPVYGLQSGKIILILEAGTKNYIYDSSEYSYENAEEDEPDAAIFSKDSLVVNGTGTLTVEGNYQCGIRSKDDLTVISGNLIIAAQSDGLKGRDSVVIKDGNIQITSGKDGIKANNDTDADKGYIWIDGGQINIAAKDDGIQAETETVINGGGIIITESQEGIAGLSVEINGGVIDITAQDDGINAAATVATEQEKMMDQDGVFVRITGGELTIDASADGIDSNGDLYIEGGALYLSGSTGGAEGILDYNGEASITGGLVFVAGNSGMMQTFGEGSTQNYLVVHYEENKEAGTELVLQDDSSTVLASFAPAKTFNTVIISVPDLEQGKTYTVMAGEAATTIEVTGIESSYGTASGRGGGGFGGSRGGQGGIGINGQPPADGGEGQFPGGGGRGDGQLPADGIDGQPPEFPEGERRGERPGTLQTETPILETES